ncbi:MAG: polysaccharide biosynthesis protein [Bacteroidales bacterium]|nr:polysaccharide biosynthesis protein [Bacteroidales bacterium]
MGNPLKKLFDKVFSRYVSTGLIFALDVMLSFLAALLVIFGVHYLVSEASGLATMAYWNRFVWVWLVASTISAAVMFWLFKSYRIIIRHSSMADIFRFCLAVLCATILDGIVLALTGLWHPNTWLVLVVYCILCIFLLIFARVVMIRTYEELQRRFRFRKNELIRVLVFGTGEKSIALQTRLRSSKHYDVVGYLTDIHSEEHLTTHNLPVFMFENAESLSRIAKKYGIGGIIFAREEDIRGEAHGLVSAAVENKLRLLIAPSIDDYVNVATQGVRNVKVEDLLGRDEISISMDKILKRFSGKVVMVTGAAGSIGSEICRQLATLGVKKLILYDNAETPMHNIRLELEDKYKNLNFVPVIGDVRQKERLDYVFRTWHPQVVFHAAAYKHVPLMEDNPCEAVLVNVIGSRNVADKCIEYGVEMMVMISTDKAVNPTNIMGCTKRLAEIYVQSINNEKTKFVTTRFGNVLGSNGSVIPRFREQIENGGPVTVTHPEITRFFMTIPEACRLVLEAATLSEGKDIFVFDMGEPVKIDHLARRMIELAGFEPDKDIKIVYSGLRPGEKLYEEVLSEKENTDPTSHDRIRIAHVRQYEYADACRFSDELEVLSRQVRIPEMVMRMKEIVPEFKSKNSRFEIYDQQ